MRRRRLASSFVCGLVVTALAIMLTACGSSSKPAYCKQKETLMADIQKLPDDLKSGGVAAIQPSFKKIQTDVENVVSSAKSDFPSETQAMTNAVAGLKTSIDALGSSPSLQSLLALVPQAQSAANTVQAFDQASSSKCK